MEQEPRFPLTIRFENGETEKYESVEDIELNLEDFDSDQDIDCEARDFLDRQVRLKVKLLRLKTLELTDDDERLSSRSSV
jgi:hypothetical protein